MRGLNVDGIWRWDLPLRMTDGELLAEQRFIREAKIGGMGRYVPIYDTWWSRLRQNRRRVLASPLMVDEAFGIVYPPKYRGI